MWFKRSIVVIGVLAAGYLTVSGFQGDLPSTFGGLGWTLAGLWQLSMHLQQELNSKLR